MGAGRAAAGVAAADVHRASGEAKRKALFSEDSKIADRPSSSRSSCRSRGPPPGPPAPPRPAPPRPPRWAARPRRRLRLAGGRQVFRSYSAVRDEGAAKMSLSEFIQMFDVRPAPPRPPRLSPLARPESPEPEPVPRARQESAYRGQIDYPKVIRGFVRCNRKEMVKYLADEPDDKSLMSGMLMEYFEFCEALCWSVARRVPKKDFPAAAALAAHIAASAAAASAASAQASRPAPGASLSPPDPVDSAARCLARVSQHCSPALREPPRLRPPPAPARLRPPPQRRRAGWAEEASDEPQPLFAPRQPFADHHDGAPLLFGRRCSRRLSSGQASATADAAAAAAAAAGGRCPRRRARLERPAPPRLTALPRRRPAWRARVCRRRALWRERPPALRRRPPPAALTAPPAGAADDDDDGASGASLVPQPVRRPRPDERPTSAAHDEGAPHGEGLPVPPAEGGRAVAGLRPRARPAHVDRRPAAPASGSELGDLAAATFNSGGGLASLQIDAPAVAAAPRPGFPLPLNGSFDFSGAGARSGSFLLPAFGSFSGLPAAAYARPGTPSSGDEGGAGPGTPDARRHAPPLAVAAPHGAASAGSVAVPPAAPGLPALELDPADFEEDLSVMGLHKFLMTLIWSFGMGGGQGFHQAAAANAVVQTFGKTLRSDAVVSVDVAPAPAALNARPPPSGRTPERTPAISFHAASLSDGPGGRVRFVAAGSASSASMAGRPSPPSSLARGERSGAVPAGRLLLGPRLLRLPRRRQRRRNHGPNFASQDSPSGICCCGRPGFNSGSSLWRR
eukprot:tig00001128_g7168.t1